MSSVGGGGCDGVADYLRDLSSFYRSAEGFCRPRQYFPNLQPYFDAATRSAVVESLIEVHEVLQLPAETLFLAVYVLDSYLSVRTVQRQDLAVVALAAMLIASKYEDVQGPTAYDYHRLSGWPRDRIVIMEKVILDHLGWNLSVPTPYVFLVALLRAQGDLQDDKMKNTAFFFAELALAEYHVMISCPPSVLAASAVYAARCTLRKKSLWTEALLHESGYSESTVLDCAQRLVELHATAAENHNYIYKRYSNPSLGAIALQPPATAPIEKVLRAGRRAVTTIVNTSGIVNCDLMINMFLDSHLASRHSSDREGGEGQTKDRDGCCER